MHVVVRWLGASVSGRVENAYNSISDPFKLFISIWFFFSKVCHKKIKNYKKNQKFLKVSLISADFEPYCQCFEEIKNPSRNIPIIIGASILLTMIIYVTVNMAYFTVMTPAEFLQSSAVAVTFGDRMFGSFSWVIPAGIALLSFER